MPHHDIIIYDTEYWAQPGAAARGWNGLDDKPPLLIQIGVFRMRLDTGLPVVAEFSAIIKPRDAHGAVVPITPYFEDLTGITQQCVDHEGHELATVMHDFYAFTGDCALYSYGHDFLNTILPSCFINNVPIPFKPQQCRDIRQVLRQARVSDDDINANSSGTLAAHFGLTLENHWAHDARCDANSILASLRSLLAAGRLDLQGFVV